MPDENTRYTIDYRSGIDASSDEFSFSATLNDSTNSNDMHIEDESLFGAHLDIDREVAKRMAPDDMLEEYGHDPEDLQFRVLGWWNHSVDTHTVKRFTSNLLSSTLTFDRPVAFLFTAEHTEIDDRLNVFCRLRPETHDEVSIPDYREQGCRFSNDNDRPSAGFISPTNTSRSDIATTYHIDIPVAQALREDGEIIAGVLLGYCSGAMMRSAKQLFENILSLDDEMEDLMFEASSAEEVSYLWDEHFHEDTWDTRHERENSVSYTDLRDRRDDLSAQLSDLGEVVEEKTMLKNILEQVDLDRVRQDMAKPALEAVEDAADHSMIQSAFLGKNTIRLVTHPLICIDHERPDEGFYNLGRLGILYGLDDTATTKAALMDIDTSISMDQIKMLVPRMHTNLAQMIYRGRLAQAVDQYVNRLTDYAILKELAEESIDLERASSEQIAAFEERYGRLPSLD